MSVRDFSIQPTYQTHCSAAIHIKQAAGVTGWSHLVPDVLPPLAGEKRSCEDVVDAMEKYNRLYLASMYTYPVKVSSCEGGEVCANGRVLRQGESCVPTNVGGCVVIFVHKS